MKFFTADLCDAHGDKVDVLEDKLIAYGGEEHCYGPITTIKLDEDNGGLIELLKSDGKGRVAVVDAGGAYCAIVGDTLMGFAAQHNWSAIIVNGYVRDVANTQHIRVGLWALGTCPRKSQKKSPSKSQVDVSFLGVDFKEGHFLYADHDGIVLSEENLV